MSWPASSAYGKAPSSGGATVSGPDGGVPPLTKQRSSLATLAEKMAAAPPRVSKIETVKVDGLVLLKIIKHCTESLPELCSGSLLGMDMNADLEVTNSFPFPASEGENNDEEDGSKGSNDGAAYQMDMLKLLRDINVDCNPVGWYRSTYLGSFCTSDLVQQLFQYQEQLDQDSVQKSVVLVYDPFQTKRGHLAIKAYRLTDAFMKMYRERKSSGAAGSVVKLSPAVVAGVGGLSGDGSAQVQAQETELSAEEIFVELPIEITNAHLFSVLLDDLKVRNGDKLDVDFDRLNLGTNSYLSNNLEFLVEEADNLAGEQSKKNQDKRRQAKIEQDQIKWILQRKMENQAREERDEPLLPEVDASQAIFKPQPISSQLESLLIKKQIGIYTQQINRFTGAGFSKLYLAGAIQGKKVA
mmetsp:Transcript_23067/g.40832  ORF Transcript_23067/g.40832 Transcript_23067/m.40832 type:complete len:412 (+) Transcript_23067:3400-4635(+)